MATPDYDGLHRAFERLSQQAARQQAQIDQLVLRCGALEHENRCLRAELEEERAAHRATKRELAQSRREYRDLAVRYDALVGELSGLDARYRRLLSKEFGSSSERLCVVGEMIPEALDVLIAEGAVAGRHRDQDGDSRWVDPIDAVRCDACCDAVHIDDATWRDAPGDRCCDDALFAFLDCSDCGEGGALWTPVYETDPAATSAAGAEATGPRVRVRPASAGGRNALSADLERRNEEYLPPADHPDLQHVVSHSLAGHRDVEKLDLPRIVPVVTVYRCPVYLLTFANGTTMRQTMVPPCIIVRGQVSDRFLVQSAVDKVADHLPSYRQEQRLARVGAIVPRAKLCRWHIALAAFLGPVAAAIRDEIFAHPVIGVDDSVHRQALPGTGKCRQNRIWAITCPEAVHYQITTTREAKWITAILAPYHGAVMGDGCASHNATLAREDIIALFCWAHARRYFVDAEDGERRSQMLALIAKLYAIEESAALVSQQERVAIRRRDAAPILAAIRMLLERWRDAPAVRPTSGIGKAVTYTLNHWDGLLRYCDIGAAPIDNNHTESCMRPGAMHRKNSLFSVSQSGADAYAVLLSLIQSAKLNHLDPVAYLLDILQDLHHERRSPAELTPAAYARRRANHAQVDDPSQPIAAAS